MVKFTGLIHSSVALTQEAQDALSRFREMTNSVSKSIQWEVGDLMIFSNKRCLHSRARIDGQRWLQRCYGSTLVGLGEVVDLDDCSIPPVPSRPHYLNATGEIVA